MIKQLKMGVWLGLVLAAGLVRAQNDPPGIKAWVDQSTVGLNQSFTLFIQLTGKGSQSVQPQMPSLDDWAAFLGSSSSQNMQITNGSMSVSKILQLQYQTVKEGRFTIPSIKVTLDGKNYSSEPLAVTVDKSVSGASSSPAQGRRSKGGQSPVQIAPEDLFVRVTANKKMVYVNEPIVLTYTIYTRVNVSSYEFSQVPATAGFWAEEIDLGQRPNTRAEVVDGKRYTAATIKQTLLFPMSAGEKILDPLGLRCAVRVQSRSRSIFDDFFNDRTATHAIASESVRIDVKPLPEEGRPAGFGGLVGRFKVQSTVDKRQLKTNEAVTYRLTVSGQGNIRGLATPAPQFPQGFEAYPPEVKESLSREGGTVSGSKTFEWVLVPRAAGRQVIPAFNLTYFDPRSKTYATQTAGEIALNIERGEGDLSESAPAIRSRQAVALIGHDIRYIKTENVRLTAVSHRFPVWIFLYVMLLPLVLIVPAWTLRRHHDRLAGDVAFARQQRAGRLAKKHLAKAKGLLSPDTQKAFYAEVGRAVTGFIGDKLNLPTAGLMSDAVRQTLTRRGVGEETIEATLALLAQCDRMRFAPASADGTAMDATYQEAEKVLNRLDRELRR